MFHFIVASLSLGVVAASAAASLTVATMPAADGFQVASIAVGTGLVFVVGAIACAGAAAGSIKGGKPRPLFLRFLPPRGRAG